MKRFFHILLIYLFLCGCSKDEVKSQCLVNGCYNEVVNNNTAYCEEHLENGNEIINKQYANSNNIKLTEAQLIECRAVVDEYCEKLMDTQSNIQAIYVPDDKPETSVLYIMYKCFVTRGDDMDIATIYVEMSDDETFEVYKMEYDK